MSLDVRLKAGRCDTLEDGLNDLEKSCAEKIVQCVEATYEQNQGAEK
jgi:hypothetical protein